MRTKLHLPLLSIGLLVLLAACKKDNPASNNNNNSNGATSYKIKTEIHTYTSGGTSSADTTNYTYDTLGRMTSFSGSLVTSTFTITGTNISINISALPTSVTGTLGANGLVQQIIQSPISSYPEFDASYSYDATGALVSDSTVYVTNSNRGLYDETHLTWTDSNLTSVNTTSYQISGSPQTSTYAFTYTNDREYRDYGFGLQYSFAWHATGIIAGRNSRNLVNTETSVINGVTKTFTHSYTFDSHGRVATETVTANDGSSDSYIYTYF